jgi:DNA-binding transcriptional regulator YiaG
VARGTAAVNSRRAQIVIDPDRVACHGPGMTTQTTSSAASRLRALRERAALSISALALRLGVDRSTLSRYEAGQRRPETGPSWTIYQWTQSEGDAIEPPQWAAAHKEKEDAK